MRVEDPPALPHSAVPMPVHVETSVPIRRRSTAPLLAVGVVLAVGIGAGGWWMASRADDGGTASASAQVGAGGCAELERLAGAWRFSTEVTAAGTLGSIGLSGDYLLDVTVDGCSAHATLAKTGYTARRFTDAQVQRGEADLQPASAPGEIGHTATFQLRDEVGKGPDIEVGLAVAEGERLVGVWRQRGKRWDRTRLSGFLDGRRDTETSVDPVLVDQPCAVRCAVVCDAAGRDLAEAAWDECTSSCAFSPGELPKCGDTRPLSSDHAVELAGPYPSLEAACDAVVGKGECEKVPRLGKQRAPSLGRKRFDAGFVEARFVVAGADAAHARPRVALETDAGWYLSGAIDGLSPGGSPSLSDLRIHARALSEGQGRRYVVGEVVASRGGVSSETLFVCEPGSPPRCVLVPTREREGDTDTIRREVTPLPGHALGIAADDDAPPGGPPLGVLGW